MVEKKKKNKQKQKRSVTARQKALVKARASGKTLAASAKSAGYKCKDDRVATSVAHAVLKRLTGRPILRDALQARLLGLDTVADYVQKSLTAVQKTVVYDENGNVKETIERDDGRSRAWGLKVIMEAFEASAAGDNANPFDAVSDDDLETLITRLGSGATA